MGFPIEKWRYAAATVWNVFKNFFFYNFLPLTTKNVGSKNWDDSDNSSEVTEVLS
jgi:hypothetical protein